MYGWKLESVFEFIFYSGYFCINFLIMALAVMTLAFMALFSILFDLRF